MAADADKPVARLQIDTRAYGPLTCEHCAEYDEENAEAETALLMEDGGIVCERCHTPFKAFEQFSGVVSSAEPVKVRRSTGARGVDKGFDIVEENPGRIRKCDLHDDPEECEASPSACRYGGCDAHGDGGPDCLTRAQHYADTKSFMCDEGRKQFLKDYRFDDRRGDWVRRR